MASRGRALGQRLGADSPVRAAARAGWPLRATIAEAMPAVLLARVLGLGLGADSPPDEPKRAEHRNLQHDGEKEDWPEPLH